MVQRFNAQLHASVRARRDASQCIRVLTHGSMRRCFRLYTEEALHHDLLAQTFPEILRSELSSVVLQLSRLGVANVAQFDYLDAPAPETMMRALELLFHLGEYACAQCHVVRCKPVVPRPLSAAQRAYKRAQDDGILDGCTEAHCS